LNVTMMTARETVDAVSSGKMSVSEAVRTALDAATRGNAALGAFLTLDPESALQSAGEVEHRLAAKVSLPLAGLPIAVKDNICVRGMTATCASRMLANFRPPYDAHVVERLRVSRGRHRRQDQPRRIRDGLQHRKQRAEGHLQSVGPTSACPAARRADRPSRSRRDLVTVAMGSDTGGSIRQPASADRRRRAQAHIRPRVALWPGRVSAAALDQIGTFTRTAEDAALW
jgi:aspartyl-tRNA(Asn)/glutamyl-tRNA(Gln) amidotransferase subunit A